MATPALTTVPHSSAAASLLLSLARRHSPVLYVKPLLCTSAPDATQQKHITSLAHRPCDDHQHHHHHHSKPTTLHHTLNNANVQNAAVYNCRRHNHHHNFSINNATTYHHRHHYNNRNPTTRHKLISCNGGGVQNTTGYNNSSCHHLPSMSMVDLCSSHVFSSPYTSRTAETSETFRESVATSFIAAEHAAFRRSIATSSDRSLGIFSRARGHHCLQPLSLVHQTQRRCLSFSSQTLQKPQIVDPVLPQVDSPDSDVFGDGITESAQTFKGLETEFPCLARVKDTGPEPSYHKVTTGYKTFSSEKPFRLQYNSGVLPRLDIAYETFGELNSSRSNAVVVLAGLSASSHVRSSVDNMAPGWWERFVGPGCALDTNKFFVISPNNVGGCYGSSGPSSVNELTGKPYGTTFPIISIEDMTNAIFLLLDHLGIDKLYGAVGSSMGGMLSLQSAASFPDRVGRLVSISACAQSHPSSIAMRYLQRKCIMVDPNWNKGHYYDGEFPKIGMKLAREIATITYRSGPEWEQRFGRGWINSGDQVSLCPTFLIESYLEHQGESFSTIYDPNSLLYLSKAMDMFDMAHGYGTLEQGLARVKCPAMVVGVQTDILFPIWQQRTLAKALMDSGNDQVTFYELNSIYGHDTFLLDLNGVGAAVKGFLETEQRHTGNLSKHKLSKQGKKKEEQSQACPLS